MLNIIVKKDIEKDKELFLDFLNDEKFLHHKKLIFHLYPQLKEFLGEADKSKEKQIISKFVENLYVEHGKKINEIIENAEELLKTEGVAGINSLVVLMDYPIEYMADMSYVASPTLLPMSPFNGNTFYFSISSELFKQQKQTSVAFIAVHEISHFILFNIIRLKYKKEPHEILGWTSLYFLKEILASVLLNQDQINSIFHKDNYLGNTLLIEIYINLNGENVQISKFFQTLYEEMRYEQEKTFTEILESMIKIIISIKTPLKGKYKMWNTYGNKILHDEKLLETYREAIKIPE